jgi:thiosulfate dehydrogenase
MRKLARAIGIGMAVLAAFVLYLHSRADEFTAEDLKRWQEQFMAVVNEGEKLFHSGNLGKNRVSCDQCHPNAANTHPETYPKFQKQLGKVAKQQEMINWCIQNPLEGDPLALDDPRLTAMEAYINYERRGIAMAPGKH